MKNGIITHPNSFNFGDDIQSLAAFKLVNKLGYNVDYLLDRENLNKKITEDKIKLINSGWFMENPLNWPPSENIEPLFISFHITHNNDAAKLMVNKVHYDYYKKHEPIGCRDYHTVSLFKSIGIDAYYSGCLTLTLENNTKPQDKTEEIIFADAFNKNLPNRFREKLFKKLVPDSIKNNIVFIEHSHNFKNRDMNKSLQFADELLNRYSRAHLVVTSRIHVALPCIAIGTPVLFLDVGFNLKNSRNRFDGITQYFNKLTNKHFPYTGIDPLSIFMRKLNLYDLYYNTKKINYDWENPKPNPIDITETKTQLEKKVKIFLESN